MMTDDRHLDPNGIMECLVCKWIVRNVKALINQDNVTVAEVEHILDTICEMSPTFIRDECHDYVHKYYNLFAQLIITMANEGQICVILHACEKKSIEPNVGALIEANSNNVLPGRDTCSPCKLLGSIVKTILENPDVLKIIRDGLKIVCDKLPDTLKNACNSELRTHWQDYINMLKNFKADQFCRNMKLCDVPNKLPELENSEKCETCQIVANMVKTMLLVSPDVALTIKNTILDSCGLMSPELKNICNHAIQMYWDQVLNMLKTYNPLDVCKTIDLCSSRNKLQTLYFERDTCSPCKLLSSIVKTILENQDLLKIMKDGLKNVCDKLPDTLKNACNSELRTHWQDYINMLKNFKADQFCRNMKLCDVPNKLPEFKNTEKCETCQIVANMVKTMLLVSPDVALTIKNTILDSCGLMSPELKKICNHAIQMYWDQVINMLKTYNPLDVCKTIDLCSSRNKLQTLNFGRDTCSPCKLLGSIVKTILENQDLLKIMRDGLKNVCDRLPDTLKNACNSELRTHWQDYINMLKNFKADQFCRNMKLCDVPNKLPKLENTEKCETCQIVANMVKTMLLVSPDVALTIKNTILDSCGLMPPELKEICNHSIQTYWDQVINMLKTYNPLDVCKTVELCSSRNKLQTLNFGRDTCSPCKLLGSIVKTILENQDLLKIMRDGLKNVCDRLPDTLKNACNSELRTHWQDYINMLKNFKADQFCRNMKLCDVPNKLPELENTEKCETCQIVANMVKTMLLVSPDVALTIKNTILDSCGLMPPELKEICNHAIQTYWDQVINMLKTYNPLDVCKTIDLCSSKNKLQTLNFGRDTCSPCKLLGSIVKTILENQDLLKIMRDGLKNVCDRLPDTLKNACNSELRTHWQDYINMLKNFKADQFCRNIKLCDVPNKLPELKNTEKCETCQIVANMVKTMLLVSPDVALTIKNTILDSCGLMPTELKEICNHAIQTYWDQVINMLKTYNPLDVCKTVELCSSRNKLQTLNFERDTCSPCKLLGSIVKTILENQDLLKIMKDGLKNVCDKLPDTLKNACNSELRTHWQDYINMLKNFKADQFCRNMKLCDVPNKLPELENTEKCETCQIVANMVKTMLLVSPDVALTIKNTILDSCGLMPPELKKICNHAIQMYWDQVINMLKTYNPLDVCKTIDLCSSRNKLQTFNFGRDTCSPCKLLGSIVKTVLENQDVLTIMRDGLKNVCDKLPDTLKNACNSELRTHWQDYIRMLTNFNADQFCRNVKLCDVPIKLPEIVDTEKCETCQNVANMVKTMLLVSPDVTLTIKNTILDSCGLMSSESPELKLTCFLELQTHWTDMSNMLGNVNDKYFCRNGNMCSANTALATINKSNSCGTCRMVIQLLKSMLVARPDLARSIKFAIIKVCGKMSASIKFVCNLAVNQYWNKLLIMIRRSIPLKICRQITLCSHENERQDLDNEVNINNINQSCATLSNSIKHLKENTDMTQGIHDALSYMCTYHKDNNLCKEQVQFFLQELMTIIKKIDTDNFCMDIEKYQNYQELLMAVAA